MVITGVIKGDILTSKEQYIVQQCNCVTMKTYGLSKYLADNLSYANPYSKRLKKSANTTSDPSTPGTIELLSGNGPTVICMYAQWGPGKPGMYSQFYPSTYKDTKENRVKWFIECLNKIFMLGIKRVAMPYNIGCGLAGGDWETYKSIINTVMIEIVLYQL